MNSPQDVSSTLAALEHENALLRRQIEGLETEAADVAALLPTRLVIEQAKGAVSARFDVTPAEALAMLRELAETSGHNIHVVAAGVVVNRGRLDARAPDEAPSNGTTPSASR